MNLITLMQKVLLLFDTEHVTKKQREVLDEIAAYVDTYTELNLPPNVSVAVHMYGGILNDITLHSSEEKALKAFEKEYKVPYVAFRKWSSLLNDWDEDSDYAEFSDKTVEELENIYPALKRDFDAEDSEIHIWTNVEIDKETKS